MGKLVDEIREALKPHRVEGFTAFCMPMPTLEQMNQLMAEVKRLEDLAEKYRLEMIRCGKGWEGEIARALKAVADEPEYPGEAPPQLCVVLNQAIENKDLDLLLHVMRQTVRLTKQCITERLTAAGAVRPSLCERCGKANISCPIYPQETQTCVEYVDTEEVRL